MTTTAATRPAEHTTSEPVLHLAFELGQATWKLGFTPGVAAAAARADDYGAGRGRPEWEIARAKVRFGLPATAAVVSCYEAGRDGFWLHRCLVAPGIANLVVDSASIEANRRKRAPRPGGMTRRTLGG